MAGAETWHRILNAIERLQATKPAEGKPFIEILRLIAGCAPPVATKKFHPRGIRRGGSNALGWLSPGLFPDSSLHSFPDPTPIAGHSTCRDSVPPDRR